jgi:outer membrane protein OmpA-like peptidoglycan-associated protein
MAALALLACGGTQKSQPESAANQPEAASSAAASGGEAGTTSGEAAAAPNQFAMTEGTGNAKAAHGVGESKIKPTKTEAAMKFVVVDKDKGPIPGIVIMLTDPESLKKYYTDETDATGYAEVLVPVGKTYDLVYLSLGVKEIAAKVPVSNEPNQSVRLTLRYKYERPAPRVANVPHPPEPGFILDGVQFDTGKATLRPDSLSRFDSVVEYMQHKKSARIEISGHTDNKGNAKQNKALSEKRAEACREYLISQGIEADRITAVGYGDERPIASNDTEAGRQQNRRIEAAEL